MTPRKRNTKQSAVEAIAGDRDLMKALMEELLQEVLEGEMTDIPGAAPSERTGGQLLRVQCCDVVHPSRFRRLPRRARGRRVSRNHR